MIDIRQLQFSYPHSSFDLFIEHLQIDSLCATAVVGPSGSGKTTLLHLMAGILLPQAGQITVNEQSVSGMSEAARRRFRLQHVGMVFQNFELIEYLSVLDNVLLPCRIGDAVALTQDVRDRALSLLVAAGLEQHVRKSVTRLSQGERQRVSICRALLTRPSVILADEPTGNLDPVTSEQILQLLLKSVSEEQATLVMVTHDHSLLHHFDQTIDFAQFLTPAAS
ncbi:MAG: ABC transporter ATP-binding protein [Planctomycetaceae bacterium]